MRMDPQYPKPRSYAPQMEMTIPSSQLSDNDRSSSELRALDCNLTSLCDHIQMEGFNSGSFSDVVLHAMGSTYHLHRLILSRSSYFRNMLHGPWKEASAPVVTLHVDDKNVNDEAITMALAYLYGHHPKLSDSNAFRVLAAASFLDLQDLCAICTDFIISELWTSNLLAYQVFAENQDYGIHGERVRNACWGYLCQSGGMELKEVLPKLSSQTLHALLTSDELWIPSEEIRFELALHTFLAKIAHWKAEHPEQGSSGSESATNTHSDSDNIKGKSGVDSCTSNRLGTVGRLNIKSDVKETVDHNLRVEVADDVAHFNNEDSDSHQLSQATSFAGSSNLEPRYACNMEGPSSISNLFREKDGTRTSCSYVEMPLTAGASGAAIEGSSEEGSNSSCNGPTSSDWGRYSVPLFPWGGRVVGVRRLKAHSKGKYGIHGDEHEAFVNIFEGGSLLYCNMSFESLLNVRKQLEELGFPCKAVNDGLWLQMLLSQRVQEIAADTCKSCCLVSAACTCRQPFAFSQGVTTPSYYMQEHNQNNNSGNMGNIYVAESSQSQGSGIFRPVRIHVRGATDGLAGIGRGTTFVPTSASPPTRFVFSRVPFGVGNRNYPQSAANDDSETQADHNVDMSGDGLTALVGLSQGGSSGTNAHGEMTQRGYETGMRSRISGTAAGGQSTGGIPMQMLEAPEHAIGIEWENTSSSSISLDLKTSLSHFPPFRFGVQFEDVHRLGDGQVKHSPEVFYAGSLWKVSVQAFNDEDPQGRRTLGLFLHRRKAEIADLQRKDVHRLGDGQVKHSPEVFYAGSLWKVSVQAFNDEDPQGRRTLGLFLHRRKAEIADLQRKVHMYVDSREKVTARYQLICPSKREVMVFGSFKQTGTLLPKAPKGWGWRTALLFDELADLLQNGALRIIAVVQLV